VSAVCNKVWLHTTFQKCVLSSTVRHYWPILTDSYCDRHTPTTSIDDNRCTCRPVTDQMLVYSLHAAGAVCFLSTAAAGQPVSGVTPALGAVCCRALLRAVVNSLWANPVSSPYLGEGVMPQLKIFHVDITSERECTSQTIKSRYR